VDINGDGKPDLVVTAGYTATGATEDEIGFKEQWNVYMNTGSGFAVNQQPVYPIRRRYCRQRFSRL